MNNSNRISLILAILLITQGHLLGQLERKAQKQLHDELRVGYQTYIEDSAHVYFTDYPSPIAPPTVRDDEMGYVCYLGKSFHCDLSNSVLVAFVNEKDSILYSALVKSKNPPSFTYCCWLAGPRIGKEILPKKYFRGDGRSKIKLFLIVRGRRKCSVEATFADGWYYWIDDWQKRGK